MEERNTVYIEKRPLTTEKDFREFSDYISSCGERAKKDPDYRNQLLYSTGMYDKDGNPKEAFL